MRSTSARNASRSQPSSVSQTRLALSRLALSSFMSVLRRFSLARHYIAGPNRDQLGALAAFNDSNASALGRFPLRKLRAYSDACQPPRARAFCRRPPVSPARPPTPPTGGRSLLARWRGRSRTGGSFSGCRSRPWAESRSIWRPTASRFSGFRRRSPHSSPRSPGFRAPVRSRSASRSPLRLCSPGSWPCRFAPSG